MESEIGKAFKDYFHELYAEEGVASKDEVCHWLGPETIKPLDLNQQKLLNQVITQDEVKKAIQTSKGCKAAGLDGIPIELYRILGDVLIPFMTSMFEEILEKGLQQHKSWGEAIATLILEPGKNPASYDSYRPISLLNDDYKIFAKILAERLSKVAGGLIHSDHRRGSLRIGTYTK